MKKLQSKHILFILLGFLLFSCSNNSGSDNQYFYVSYVSRVGQAPAPLKIPGGSALSLEHLPDLHYEDYTFNGWYLEDELIRPKTYVVKSDIVLNAKWTGVLCEVSFTHTDNISGQDFTKALEKGDEITLPKSPYGTKTGLEFKGWLCNGIYYAENSTYVVNGNVTFTAYYAEQGEHTISYYHVFDGVMVTAPEALADIVSLTGTSNPPGFSESEAVFISDLQKTGYTFGGWYTNRTCETKADTYWKEGTVTRDITLYGKWNVKTYNISFDANAGELIDPADTHADVSATYEEEITLPQCKYYLTGCEFVAWSVNAESFENEFLQNQTVAVKELCSDSTSNTIKLYAHWRDAVPPSAPTNFRITNVERNQISFAWTFANENGLAYTRLSYSKKGSGKNEFIDFASEDYAVGSNIEYTIKNLEFGTAYSFTLTSYDIAGNSNNYDARCVLMAAPRPQAYVPKLTFAQTSPTQLVISWDAPDAQEYPLIEKIGVYVDDTEVHSYAAADGQGDCYDKESYTYTVTPLTPYNIHLEIAESVDAAGRTNSATTLNYAYLSEPDYNVQVQEVCINGNNYSFWSYSDSLGFALEKPVDENGDEIPSNLYSIYAECTPLDANGNEIKRNKTLKSMEFDSTRGVYIRDALEADTSYNVRIFVSSELGGQTSYSYSLAEQINDLKTASRFKAEPGYICYNANSYYKQVQNAGIPIGIVTKVNSFHEAKTVMALEDISVTSLAQATEKATEKTEGNLSWKVPKSAEIELAFDSEIVQVIMDSLEKAAGTSFSTSTTNPDGTFENKYITQTAGAQAGTIIAYDISGLECSSAQSVASNGSTGTFILRPFATITAQE